MNEGWDDELFPERGDVYRLSSARAPGDAGRRDTYTRGDSGIAFESRSFRPETAANWDVIGSRSNVVLTMPVDYGLRPGDLVAPYRGGLPNFRLQDDGTPTPGSEAFRVIRQRETEGVMSDPLYRVDCVSRQ